MSREIKFRAWDASKGRFVIESDLVHVALSGDVSHCSDSGVSNRNDLELQQYTGLKERNGVEIYEGDILGIKLGGPPTYGLVVFEDAAFMMKNSNIESLPNLADVIRVLPGYEVIGNIYENPNLLEGNTNASI